jgi:hypothetical protein
MTHSDVSVVVYQQGDWWIGQCLEYDITAQANSPTELHHEIERVLFAHVCASIQEGRTPFDGLSPAPIKFWKMWERASLRLESDGLGFKQPIPANIPPVVAKLKLAELNRTDH